MPVPSANPISTTLLFVNTSEQNKNINQSNSQAQQLCKAAHDTEFCNMPARESENPFAIGSGGTTLEAISGALNDRGIRSALFTSSNGSTYADAFITGLDQQIDRPMVAVIRADDCGREGSCGPIYQALL